MRRTLLVTLGLILAAAGTAPAASTPDPAAVTVRTETVTYDLRHSPLAPGPQAPNGTTLTDKGQAAAEAVVLENEYLTATVVPALGGRLVRVTFKKPRRDLLWTSDTLDAPPQLAGGGSCFSWPTGTYSHSPTGYRIVKNADGSVTVAMDQRFRFALDRFAALREATFVTVRPGVAWVEYTTRVDNALPLRCGFRLWNTACFPPHPGAEVLLPAARVLSDPLDARHTAWNVVEPHLVGAAGHTYSAVENGGDWTGVYYADADANHLVLRSRWTAFGSRIGVPGPGKPLTVDSGSNTLPDHPGHYLPPFGTYTLPLRLTMVSGIGRIDWTDGLVALAYDAPRDDADAGATVRLVAFQTLPHGKLTARTTAETVEAAGTATPDRPLVVRLAHRAEPVLVTVTLDDAELASISLPWHPDPTPTDALETLKSQTESRDWLAAELAAWDTSDGRGLSAAVTILTRHTESPTPDDVIQTARLLMRTQAPGSHLWSAGRRNLEGVVRRGAPSPLASIYLAMMMTLDSGGLPTPEALEKIGKDGAKYPAARYLAALYALSAENPAAAVTHLKACAAQVAPVAMGLGSEAIGGNDALHPAATIGAEWPNLLRASALIAQDRPAPAAGVLEALLLTDPARPEALLLLAEAYTKAGQADLAQKMRVAADGLLRGNDAAREDFDRLQREVKTGRWTSPARP